MIATLWLWWGVEQLTDYRRVRQIGVKDQAQISYWYALIASPCILGGALIWWRRDCGIIVHGACIEAKIISFGAESSGLRDLVLCYPFAGKLYRITQSLNATSVAGKKPGDKLDVIVDRRKATRIKLP